MSDYAPILIPTLNRIEHFKRCIDSLSLCTYANKTDLFIALDYPLKETHWPGYLKIEEFSKEIKGFNSVTIIKRTKNFGALKNYFESRKELFQKFDRLIFTEDDNEFSANFIDYLNKGLSKFENNKNIYAICGYNYPLSMPKNYQKNFYYNENFTAWGFGIWRDRIRKEIYSPKELFHFIKNFRNIRRLYIIKPSKILAILDNVMNKKPLYGDSVVTIENCIHESTCVFPTISKVRNHGHDGSGVNCSDSNDAIYSIQKIDDSNNFDFDNGVPIKDKRVFYAVKRHFHLGTLRTIKAIILYVLVRIRHIYKINT